MTPPSADLAARRPVWAALSELFLDTDIAPTLAWRVRTLAQSPYSIDELQAILVDEVTPACRWNLLSVAGEWAGFDLDALEGAILARAAQRSRSPWRRRLDPARWTVPRWRDWQITREGVAAARQAPP